MIAQMWKMKSGRPINIRISKAMCGRDPFKGEGNRNARYRPERACAGLEMSDNPGSI